MYGTDCLIIKPKDVKRLKTCEGNTIKSALGLPHRLWTTALFLALNMDTTEATLRKQKLSLMCRLIENEFTRDIINTLLKSKTSKDSIVAEIIKLVGASTTSEELRTKCYHLLQQAKNGFESEKKMK